MGHGGMHSGVSECVKLGSGRGCVGGLGRGGGGGHGGVRLCGIWYEGVWGCLMGGWVCVWAWGGQDGRSGEGGCQCGGGCQRGVVQGTYLGVGRMCLGLGASGCCCPLPVGAGWQLGGGWFLCGGVCRLWAFGGHPW